MLFAVRRLIPRGTAGTLPQTMVFAYSTPPFQAVDSSRSTSSQSEVSSGPNRKKGGGIRRGTSLVISAQSNNNRPGRSAGIKELNGCQECTTAGSRSQGGSPRMVCREEKRGLREHMGGGRLRLNHEQRVDRQPGPKAWDVLRD